jgi:hypothetical protein
MRQVAHADGPIEADGRPPFLDEEFDTHPTPLQGNLRNGGHQGSRGSRVPLFRQHIKRMRDAHGLAAPSGIAAEERHEADRLGVAFRDKRFEKGAGPKPSASIRSTDVQGVWPGR